MISSVAPERVGMVFHRETSPLVMRDTPALHSEDSVAESERNGYGLTDSNWGSSQENSSFSYQSLDNSYSRTPRERGNTLTIHIPPNRYGAEACDQNGSHRIGMLEDEAVALSPAEKVVRMLESSGEFVEPVSISWRNINVHVPPEEKTWCSRQHEEPVKQILKNVTGSVTAGKLLAILGSSGGGKTTLLNVINYRNREKLIVSGEILINGVDLGKGIRNLSAYVQQNDLFIGMLTVKEHLIFRAMLRMDKKLGKAKRLQRVDEVIHELGLKKCADTLIGIPGRKKGISGGEMKRLSFASEILTNPPLIFCDEPTSGLDSFMAANVIQTLSNMANKARTVVCVIHQPSSDVYNMFDEVLYMAEGKVAFMGPLNEANSFFKSMGYPCPKNYNPADHIINTLAIVPGQEHTCRSRVKAITDSYEGSDWMRTIQEKAEEDGERAWQNVLTFNTEMIDGKRYIAPWLRQFYYVIWRTFRAQRREPYVFKARTVQILVVTIAIGLIYQRNPYDPYTQKSITDINGLMFFVMTNLSFTYMFAVLQVFFDEIPIFLREHATGLYYTSAYFIGKNVADLPFYTMLPTMLIVIVYWMGGLNPDVSIFFTNLLLGIIICNIGTGFGYIMSISVKKFEMSLLITPSTAIILMMFAGFFINAASIPSYLSWIQYISWFHYGNEAYIINQWHDVTNLTCIIGNTTSAGPTSCFTNGIQIIEYYDFNPDFLWQNVGILVVYIVVFRVLALTILHIRAVRTAS